jgi:hypothetical protein
LWPQPKVQARDRSAEPPAQVGLRDTLACWIRVGVIIIRAAVSPQELLVHPR